MSYKNPKDVSFIGQDRQVILHVQNATRTESIDISSWALRYMVKRRHTDADGAAVVDKATGSGITIAGVFNANPALNLQRATATIADTDTDGLTPATYYAEWKRTDANFETVLAYNDYQLVRGVIHA